MLNICSLLPFLYCIGIDQIKGDGKSFYHGQYAPLFPSFFSSPYEEYFCKEAICAEQQWGLEVVQCFSAACREMK